MFARLIGKTSLRWGRRRRREGIPALESNEENIVFDRDETEEERIIIESFFFDIYPNGDIDVGAKLSFESSNKMLFPRPRRRRLRNKA